MLDRNTDLEDSTRWETVDSCPLCGSGAVRDWRRGCADSTGIDVTLAYGRCRSCDCRFLRSRVTEAHVGGLYGHSYAPYTTPGAPAPGLVGADGTGTRLQKELAVTYRPGGPAGRVLDFGCGSAVFVNAARAIGWDTTAVDFSETGLSGARRAGHDVRLVDAEFWDWLDGQQFDVIRLSHVIEHLYEPDVQVERLLKALNPGGVLHVVTPDPTGPACLFARRRSNFFQLVHVTLIPPRSLASWASGVGAGHVTTVPEITTKDMWRSLLLATGRIRSYEGAPERPKSRILQTLIAVIAQGFAAMGRADRYHMFIRR